MKIEAGKFYKTRDGQKVGPMTRTHDGFWKGPWPITSGSGEYLDDGTKYIGMTHGYDLVSELSEGPIRTVTRREIVPGDYGPIRILASSKSNAVIQLLDSTGGKATNAIAFTAEEIRESAHIFNQLAEALEDKS